MTTTHTRRSGTKGKETTASHSVRTPNDVWHAATKKAERDGLKINRVIIELLVGWVRGVYRLPKRQVEEVRVYGAQAPTASIPVAEPVQ